MSIVLLALALLGDVFLGIVLWLGFDAVGWDTQTSAFVAGCVGAWLSSIGLGAMLNSGERRR